MTVEEFANPVVYSYTGAGDFTFNFRVFDSEDLRVVYTDTDGIGTNLVKDTDYTVTVEDTEPYGGTIHCTYSASSGRLEIRRELEITQDTDWVNNDDLDAEILERNFDRMTMICQQLKVDVDEMNAITNWRGTWATGEDYSIRDVVANTTAIYVATTSHTAGASFASDLAAGYWAVAVNLNSILVMGLPDIAAGDALKLVSVKSDESGYELREQGLPPGYIDGLECSHAADTDHDITIAAGSCRDSSDTYDCKLASALTKQIDVAWAAGDTAGGMIGTLAANTLYLLGLLRNNTTGALDAGWNITATAPSGWTWMRTLMFYHTDSSSNIRQIGSALFDGRNVELHYGPRWLLVSGLSATTYTTQSLATLFPASGGPFGLLYYTVSSDFYNFALSNDGVNQASSLVATFSDYAVGEYQENGGSSPVRPQTFTKINSNTIKFKVSAGAHAFYVVGIRFKR